MHVVYGGKQTFHLRESNKHRAATALGEKGHGNSLNYNNINSPVSMNWHQKSTLEQVFKTDTVLLLKTATFPLYYRSNSVRCSDSWNDHMVTRTYGMVLALAIWYSSFRAYGSLARVGLGILVRQALYCNVVHASHEALTPDEGTALVLLYQLYGTVTPLPMAHQIQRYPYYSALQYSTVFKNLGVEKSKLDCFSDFQKFKVRMWA